MCFLLPEPGSVPKPMSSRKEEKNILSLMKNGRRRLTVWHAFTEKKQANEIITIQA